MKKLSHLQIDSFRTDDWKSYKKHIPADKHTLSFQSRLDNKWLTPFSDKVVEDLAKKGKKNIDIQLYNSN